MKLTVSESLLLFCLDDQTGKFRTMPEGAFDHALAGAILAELEHQQLIVIGENQVVLAPSVKPLAEKELVRALTLLREIEQPSLSAWTSRLSSKADEYSALILDRLVEQKILRKEEEAFLWVFQRERYETLDLSGELAVRDRIREVILDETREPTREESVLIALVDVCQLSSLMLSHAELERSKERIQTLSKHDLIGKAVRGTLRELQRIMLEYQSYTGI